MGTNNSDFYLPVYDELWERPDITDAVFLNIRENLSGAVIIGGKFHKANELKSGAYR